MRANRILVIGGAENVEVREAIARRGYEIVAINFPEAIAVLEPHPSIVHAEGVDFSHTVRLVRRICEMHREWSFAAIVAVCEFGRLPGALAAGQLGLPGATVKTVQNTKDKVRMRTILAQAGLGQVQFRKCDTLAEAAEFLLSIGKPMILKPILGTGSDGVSRVTNAPELHAAWEKCTTARSFGGVLCEEFIDGEVVSVEGYSVGGTFVPAAITERVLNEQGQEIGHHQPAAISDALRDEVFAFTGKTVAALGITDGISHTEVKLSPNGPVFIETHTRNGGCRIPLLTRLSTGIDLADAQVAFALGEEVPVREAQRGVAAAVRFLPATGGIVTYVDVPEIDEEAGVIEAGAYVREGDLLSGRSSLLDRMAYVVTTARRANEACAKADAFLNAIEIIVEEELERSIA